MKKSAPDITTSEELAGLRARLQEAEDTLEAIRQGSIDAVVVKQQETQQIYTLQSADHTYRVLIESMNQGALTLASDGTILYSNSQFSQLIGKPLEQIIGTPYEELFDRADRPALLRLVTGSRTQPMPNLEVCLPGEPYTVVVISATHLPRAKDNAYMGVVITDITERKRAERAKDEFISLASHQLRTPATSVKQYLGMLLEGYVGDLDDSQRPYVQTAYTSNDDQLAIINTILRTAQIDSGVYTLKKTTQNLAELLEQITASFRALMLMHRQTLISEVAADIEICVDRADFTLALTNLIENASKYSPDGTTIIVKASRSGGTTRISVTDRGVGIKPEDRSKVFDKFTRVDNELSDTVNGSGLGLYWVKRVITLHGGRIELESDSGRGSTFTILLEG